MPTVKRRRDSFSFRGSKRVSRPLWKRLTEGAVIGTVTGVFVVHPAAMLVHGLTYPELRIAPRAVLDAASVEHVPMAIFFALLGCGLGIALAYYVTVSRRKEERVRQLEDLLPICSYCSKIRVEDGIAGTFDWLTPSDFLERQNGMGLTHGICPECEAAFRETHHIHPRRRHL